MKRQNLETAQSLHDAARRFYSPHMDERPGILRVDLPEKPSAMAWCVWAYGIEQKVQAGYSLAAILRDNRDNLARYKAVDEFGWERLAAMLGAK